jgi:peptide/nickel transport system ATP-binding protein
MGLLPGSARRSADAIRLGEDDLLVFSEVEMARKIRGDRMAMIFQEPMTCLNPVYTIGRQLTEAMLLHRKVSHAEATARAVSLLDRVGIPAAASRLGQYPHQLSGGQRQRVMIAMALMNGPELIIADEPTTALDVTIQAQILRLLNVLQRELKMAMILITHNLGIVARMADRVAVMYAGEFVETGRTAELFAAPKHPYTAGLLASIPVPGRLSPGARLGSIRGMVPSLIGKMRGCAFANRCDYASEACRASDVPVRHLGPERSFRCVLEDGVPGGAATPGAGEFAAQALTGAPSNGALVSAEGVRCVFRVRRGFFTKPKPLVAVDDVRLGIARGEVLGLVGESGCGKTTLARILLGLQPITEGQVLVKQQPLGEVDQKVLARLVQPIFQDPYSSLNPRKTIGQIIRRPLDVHQDGDARSRDRKVQEIMERVGLPRRFVYSYPNQVSGGQRQRVAIARAVIMKPDVIICDEPTSALDVSVQAQILNLLLDLRDEFGLTYLLITHDLAVVRHMASRIAVMYLGEIVEAAPSEDVFRNPRHPYTRALLQSVMTLDPGAGIPDNRMGHSFPNPLEMPAGCRFHPRCPEVMPLCRETPSPLVYDGAALVRCHLYRAATE